MNIIALLLFLVYISSIIILANLYSENDISVNIWSILGLVLPIINTILVIYLKHWKNIWKDNWFNKIFKEDLPLFINELKKCKKNENTF